jgi:very-short-patch-repair endonuclease
MTDAERKLWRALRARNVGAKFRRQAPLGPYVVDFVCFESKVIVEVDGGQHADNAKDAIRDRYFSDRGYRVLRFWNNDVLRNLDGVLISIAATHPSPGAPKAGAPPSPSLRAFTPVFDGLWGEGVRASLTR